MDYSEEFLAELAKSVIELQTFRVEPCDREPVERDPLPPYKERLHPRTDWKRKPYWLRTRSNPKRRG